MTPDIEVHQEIEQITRRIIEQYRPEKVILFGSHAYGTPDSESDVDLLIVKETDERPIDRRVAVRRIVYTLRRSVPFSPLVITPQELAQRLAMGDPFYHKIVTQGKVLYAHT